MTTSTQELRLKSRLEERCSPGAALKTPISSLCKSWSESLQERVIRRMNFYTPLPPGGNLMSYRIEATFVPTVRWSAFAGTVKGRDERPTGALDSPANDDGFVCT